MENTGFVISTFGSPAYVDLQLALHKGRWCHDCIVSDDGSQDSMLQSVCRKWNVPLFGNKDKRMGHQKGDAKAFSLSFDYFKEKDWIFKISRRFLWLKDFTIQLPQSDYMKSPVLSDWWVPQKRWQNNRAFTSCCIGFYIPAIPQLLKQTFSNLPEIVREPGSGWFMQPALFKLFNPYFSQPLTIWRSLYKERGREVVGKDVLWKNNAQPYQYKLLADILGLKWSLEAFQV